MKPKTPCFSCFPPDNPASVFNLFKDLSNSGFHCSRPDHAKDFHDLIPDIAVGWSCCLEEPKVQA